jgi:site-specific DNA-methyltransferase (adenine-specific)
VVTLNAGRWPANLCHDGSEEVMACFPDSAGQQADISTTAPSAKTSNVYGKMNREGEASANRRYTDNGGTNFSALPGQRRGDSGSAARFFTAKADSHDRIASKHPTVKPLDLMQWLCRLITPKGGTILDPFAGTGTTGEAAWREGFRAILIEREAEYQADIARRMDLAENPTKRAAVAKTKGKIDDHGPLFSGGDPAP